MGQYRKKPVVVEARQWDGKKDSAEDLVSWIFGAGGFAKYQDDFAPSSIIITTLEGNMQAVRNDFIIKGVKDEFYPCKPDIFDNTYEEVDESDAS